MQTDNSTPNIQSIRGVIDRALWTAGATEQNRQLLAEAILEELKPYAEANSDQAVESTKQFLSVARAGGFKGTVVVDNDSVIAWDKADEPVFEFLGRGPQDVLIDVLNALGVEASSP